MALYESVFIARQDVAATQVDAIAEQFTGILAGLDGKVTKKEYWGLRSLTFRIKKNRKGHYVLFNIEASPAAVAEMERNMRLHEDVLRYLTIKVDALDPNPSPIMQRDRDRERDRERDGRSGWDEQSAAEAAAGRAGGERGTERSGERRERRPRRSDGDAKPRE